MSETAYIHTEDIHNFSAAEQVLPFIIETFHPESILDVGCGIGTWLAIASKLGVAEIKGLDGDYVDKSLLKIPNNCFIASDLMHPINLKRKFDLVLCLEVAEHLPSTKAQILIDTLTEHSDIIIFSAAIPGQDGQNHINEQWQTYWQALFRKKAFFAYDILRPRIWNNEKIDWWYRQNIIIYAKKHIHVLRNEAPCDPVLNLVHPELFLQKNQKVEQLYSRLLSEATNPNFFMALKKLLKSIVRFNFSLKNK